MLCRLFSSCRKWGLLSSCGVQASHCRVFSYSGAQAVGSQASVVVAHGLSSCDSRALEHRLNNCGSWALLLCSMWNLPGPGIEPMSPALAGRLFTTELPGKSLNSFFKYFILYWRIVDLQHCISLMSTAKQFSYTYTSVYSFPI